MKNKILLASSLSLLTLAANSVFANSTYVPAQHDWYVNLKALYTQPSNINHTEQLAGPEKSVVNTEANYDPAIDITLGYFVTNSDDVSLHYMHAYLSSSHSSSNSAEPTEKNNQFYNFERVKFLDNYNSLALRLGHYYDSENYHTHVFAGIDYTTIKDISLLKATYPDFDRDQPEKFVPQDIRSINMFNGLGPQIGFETSYKFRDHFSILGGADFSLLASSASDPGDVGVETTSYNAALKAQANVGLGFQMMVAHNHLLDLELGYQGTYIQSNSIGNSYSMHGPYIGFKVHA